MWWTSPKLEIVFLVVRETQRNRGIPNVMVAKNLAASRWYKVDAVTAKDLTIAACMPSTRACAGMLKVDCWFVDIRTRGGDVVHGGWVAYICG